MWVELGRLEVALGNLWVELVGGLVDRAGLLVGGLAGWLFAWLG